MIDKIRLLSLVALLALIIVMVIFLLKLSLANKIAPSLNQSEISVINKNCMECSNSIPYSFSYILSEFGYSPYMYNETFGTALGDSIISSNFITTLPSIVVPQTVLSSSSSLMNLVSSLVYSNILTLNQNNNNLVLNTPFAAGLFGPLTFYSILENSTQRSIPINFTKLYGVENQSNFESKLINPVDPIILQNQSHINNSKIFYVYGNSPFSSLESVIFRDALKNFGNFSNNITAFSGEVSVTKNESLGPQIGYLLSENGYKSSYFSIYFYNISSVESPYARNLILEFDQNAISSGSPYGNFIPLIDIGGRYIIVSSQLKPTFFNGMNLQQIENTLASNQSIGTAFNDSVYLIDSMLCSLSKNSADICSNSIVADYESNILS
ncbi:MAG: hypothetical protein ACP5MT_00070 [Candidatus Acidifodinimicrobium sp.]